MGKITLLDYDGFTEEDVRMCEEFEEIMDKEKDLTPERICYLCNLYLQYMDKEGPGINRVK